MNSTNHKTFKSTSGAVYAVAIGQRLGMSETELRAMLHSPSPESELMRFVTAIGERGLIGVMPTASQLAALSEHGFSEEVISAYASVGGLIQPLS
jgi:hypothetical protein